VAVAGACTGAGPAADFNRGKGRANRASLRGLVASGQLPGLLAYLDGAPGGLVLSRAAQCIPPTRAGPRAPANRCRTGVVGGVLLRRPGASPPGCFVALLEGAASFARRRGARILEGYPVDPRESDYADTFAWTGTAAAFRAAGFTEAAASPRSPHHAARARCVTGPQTRRLRIFRDHDISNGDHPERGRGADSC
jgi:hypothetical protein